MMVYYKPLKFLMNALDLEEVIINKVAKYHDFSSSIVNEQG